MRHNCILGVLSSRAFILKVWVSILAVIDKKWPRNVQICFATDLFVLKIQMEARQNP